MVGSLVWLLHPILCRRVDWPDGHTVCVAQSKVSDICLQPGECLQTVRLSVIGIFAGISPMMQADFLGIFLWHWPFDAAAGSVNARSSVRRKLHSSLL